MRKEEIMKRIFVGIALLFMVFFVYVTIAATCNLNEAEMSIVDYVVAMENKCVITNSIGAHSLDSLYSTLNEKNLSEYEKTVCVLKEHGVSNEIIESMNQNDVNSILENAEAIQVEVKYLVANSAGKVAVMGESEYIALIDQYNNGSSPTGLDHRKIITHSADKSYMRITILSIYIDPSSNSNVSGWFDIHVWYEWLVLDNQRYTDTISISADNFVWSDKKQSDYASSCYYKLRDLNGNESTHRERVDGDSGEYGSHGMRYAWLVPQNSGNSLIVTYLQYYLRGKGHINDVTQNGSFNVNAKYEHTIAIEDAD